MYNLSQFSSVLFKIYALGKARKCSTWPQKFRQLCHWNTFNVGLINIACQPLLGVILSQEFVNLYFPYAGQGLLFFRW